MLINDCCCFISVHPCSGGERACTLYPLNSATFCIIKEKLMMLRLSKDEFHVHVTGPRLDHRDLCTWGLLPWSGPSRRRRGRPGTCSYRTWRGRRFWSQFHSWGRGAETHRAVGQATALQRGFKYMALGLFSCLLLYGIAFPCWRGPQPNRKAFSP